MAGPADVLHDLSGVRVLVLGDALVDGYLQGEASRPGPGDGHPVVAVRRRLDLPGGAAASAAAVAALGGHARLLSVVGDDEDGRALRERLHDAGVDPSLNLSSSRRTFVRRRVAGDGGTLLRFDEGDVSPVSPANEAWLLDQLTGEWPEADAVLVTDHGLGTMTPAVRAELRRLQRTHPHVLVVDAHDPGVYAGCRLTVSVLDAHDALLLVGAADGRRRNEALEEHARDLLVRTGAQLVAVRVGSEGAFFAEAGHPSHRTYSRVVPARESSGAARTFTAALTLALGAGAQTWTAAEVATGAAAVAAVKGRTSVCASAELGQRLSPLEKVTPDVRRLTAELDDRRAHGQRIVFTAGCFDGSQGGHAEFLERARAAGDVLVVGVRSGDGACAPQDRPPAGASRDRLTALAGLSCVDAVVPLADADPDELVRALRPHVVAAAVGEAEPEGALSTAAHDADADVVLVPRAPDVARPSLLERVIASRPVMSAAEDAA